jgi:hypothetical protein
VHHTRAVLIGIGIALLPCSSFAQQPVLVLNCPLRQVHLGLVADSIRGVTLIAAPSPLSSQDPDSFPVTSLRFHPDSLGPWLELVHASLQASTLAFEPDGIRWAPTLRALGGRGAISIGRPIRHEQLGDQRQLLIVDGGRQWNLELSAEETGRLMSQLREVASAARLAPDEGESPRGYRYPDEVEKLPRVTSQPPLRGTNPSIKGQVLLQFVVDSAGRPDPGTLVVLMATNPRLEDTAKSFVTGWRFQPAVSRGRAVPILVEQMLAWR